MGKRKNQTKPNQSQVEGAFKSSKKECISDSKEPSQTSSTLQVQESSSSDAVVELSKAQAALKALQHRFAEVVAENQALQNENKQIQAVQTENKQLQAQLIQERRESSRSRALVHDLTFEVDDLKTELTFLR